MVAYTALTIDGDLGVKVPVACWFPVDDSDPAASPAPVRYRHRISVRKIGRMLAGWDFIPEFLSRDFELEPTLSTVVSADDSGTSGAVLPTRAPVVLLAHGYLGSRFDLSHLAERLASQGFVCLAPEYPESLAGSFETTSASTAAGDEETPLRPLTRARITAALLDALTSEWNVQPTSYGIVGHSLGCGTALETGDETWSRVLIAGFPRTRDGRPLPGNDLLLLMSMNDGAMSLSRWGGKESIPSDFVLLDSDAVSSSTASTRRLPRRAAVVLEGEAAPNHISFLADNVNTAMIDLLSPLLPVAQAFKIPVLDFDAYQQSRDSAPTARIVHPLVVQYLSERMLQQ
jgi:pimeloyl-ACP methyl ester carboxylesterase